ncbi:MAG: Uma2 family endonuclease [Planctomycetota bacterium]
MTQALTPTERPVAETDNVPPLVNGDHLTREEFHRRYEAMPEVKKAELIEGVVYMPSPVSLNHSEPHDALACWRGFYRMRTPGLISGMDSTVFLDGINEPQPDVALGIPRAAGGQTDITVVKGRRYIGSAPELCVEVAMSTSSIDLNAKLRSYERNGVQEYVVVLGEPPEVRWMVLENGRFERIDLDDGLYKSRAFPGLWLDPAALLAGNLTRLADAVQRGCSEDQRHAAFVEQLGAVEPSG